MGGKVTVEQLRAIADAAEQYGQDYVHLTSRQGVEIPYVRLEEIDQVKETLAQGDVVPGVCGPRVRTVTACQGAAICPSGCIDTYGLAEELDAHYFGRELPHKFKFGVTGCQNNCLKAEENDVGIKGAMNVHWNGEQCIFCGVCEKVCRTKAIHIEGGEVKLEENACNHCGRCVKSCPVDAWEGTPGYLVSFGGTFGNHIGKGEELLPLVQDRETLFRVTDAAINFFAEYAKPGERFRFTCDRVGWDKLKERIEEAYHG